jgi:hypothetical protein
MIMWRLRSFTMAGILPWLVGASAIALGLWLVLEPGPTWLPMARCTKGECVEGREWLSFGLTGAVILAGLFQYRSAQQWKRAEFLAGEMRTFFSTPGVAKATTMVDWGYRNVNLFDQLTPFTQWPVVDRGLQSQALLPHPLVDRYAGSDSAAAPDSSGAERGFTMEQAMIRDCYDTFLDGLERFSSYVTAGLVSARDLRPYLGYWIDDIAQPTADVRDAQWNCCLFAYIEYYRYTGVQDLFLAFGHDISSRGGKFRGFLAQVPNRDLAKELGSLLDEAAKSRASI